MTSRTSDIYCSSCKRYLFSVYKVDFEKYYCNKKVCTEQALVDKLRGDDVCIEGIDD